MGKVVLAGILLAQRTGGLIVTLAPRWLFGIIIHDCLNGTKIGLEFHHGVLMDGDVASCHARSQ